MKPLKQNKMEQLERERGPMVEPCPTEEYRPSVSITEVGDFETLTYPPTKNYNSERNNRTGTRPQFWLYCVIGRLF